MYNYDYNENFSKVERIKRKEKRKKAYDEIKSCRKIVKKRREKRNKIKSLEKFLE